MIGDSCFVFRLVAFLVNALAQFFDASFYIADDGSAKLNIHRKRNRMRFFRQQIPNCSCVVMNGFNWQSTMSVKRLLKIFFGNKAGEQIRSEEHTSELQSLRHLV